ncbi:MAG TPA: sigma-70 family RNA polymerase sigma factor [Solirubrobacterales bacterium]|nr:sigma-70 family RNA polymerase sigma factor [Solirubrobacterales bacterium]
MEASALTHASQRGLLARRSPLLKLQGDARLIAMARSGNTGAFETIVDRYQSRLLGFCRQMLNSTEDAEDVLQEVFVNAYRAMLADEREINLRPWLYRIARNRCLNQLRKPTADAQESMDMVPAVEAASTAEKVSNREEFRQLLTDVGKLPETQRTALLLREMDAMSYEEIAATMETSVPSVKSLLVRARISLAEASQARQLTCGEVRLELAEAAEGLRKVSGPVRRHVRDCEECADFRSQVRSNDKVMAALFPAGALVAFKSFIAGKLGLGGASGGASAGATGGAGAAGAGASATAGTAGATAAATGAGAGAVSSVGAALSSGGAASGIGAVGGAIGTKAVAGVVTAAVLTAGAVSEVNQKSDTAPAPGANPPAKVSSVHRQPLSLAQRHVVAPLPTPEPEPVELTAAPAPQPPAATEAPPPQAPTPPAEPSPVPAPETGATTAPSAAGPSTVAVDDETQSTPTAKAVAPKVNSAKSPTSAAGAPAGSETVVVTVGGTAPPAETAAPEESAPPAAEEGAPPVESTPPPEEPSAEPTPPPASPPAEVEAEVAAG